MAQTDQHHYAVSQDLANRYRTCVGFVLFHSNFSAIIQSRLWSSLNERFVYIGEYPVGNPRGHLQRKQSPKELIHYKRGAGRLLSFFYPSYVASHTSILLFPIPYSFTLYPFTTYNSHLTTTHIQLAPFFTSTLK